jgi:hypothetical protein
MMNPQAISQAMQMMQGMNAGQGGAQGNPFGGMPFGGMNPAMMGMMGGAGAGAGAS